MRILSVAMIGLALLAAGCSSPQRTAAPASQSGAAASPAPAGDSIDRFAVSAHRAAAPCDTGN